MTGFPDFSHTVWGLQPSSPRKVWEGPPGVNICVAGQMVWGSGPRQQRPKTANVMVLSRHSPQSGVCLSESWAFVPGAFPVQGQPVMPEMAVFLLRPPHFKLGPVCPISMCQPGQKPWYCRQLNAYSFW